MITPGCCAWRVLADERAAVFENSLKESSVAQRVDAIRRHTKDRQGRTGSMQCTSMGRAVDAASSARDHH